MRLNPNIPSAVRAGVLLLCTPPGELVREQDGVSATPQFPEIRCAVAEPTRADPRRDRRKVHRGAGEGLPRGERALRMRPGLCKLRVAVERWRFVSCRMGGATGLWAGTCWPGATGMGRAMSRGANRFKGPGGGRDSGQQVGEHQAQSGKVCGNRYAGGGGTWGQGPGEGNIRE